MVDDKSGAKDVIVKGDSSFVKYKVFYQLLREIRKAHKRIQRVDLMLAFTICHVMQ